MTTTVLARGLRLPAKLGRSAVRYNAVLVEQGVLIMGIVDDFAATMRGLRLRAKNASTEPLFPRYHLAKADLASLVKRLALPASLTIGGKAVPATWQVSITDGGTLRIAVDAPGLAAAMDGGVGARLAIEDDALVETIDTEERDEVATRAAAREAQRAALAKGKAAFLRAIGAKRATLVDDEDEGLPFLRAAGRFTIDQLVAKPVPGTLVADAWDYRSDVTRGVRLYAPMAPRDLAVQCMWPDQRISGGDFAELVDALVAEAGAKIVYVDHNTLYLVPTKRRGKLARTEPLLRSVCDDPELEAEASEYVAAIRAGDKLVFWWD